MSSTDKRYPQSAPDGTPIPFDIGYLSGLMIESIAVAASSAVSLPAAAVIAVIYATCECVVLFGDGSPSAALTEGAFLTSAVFVPKNGLVSIQIPALKFSCISADGASTGKLYITVFERWEGLSQDLLGRRM